MRLIGVAIVCLEGVSLSFVRWGYLRLLTLRRRPEGKMCPCWRFAWCNVWCLVQLLVCVQSQTVVEEAESTMVCSRSHAARLAHLCRHQRQGLLSQGRFDWVFWKERASRGIVGLASRGNMKQRHTIDDMGPSALTAPSRRPGSIILSQSIIFDFTSKYRHPLPLYELPNMWRWPERTQTKANWSARMSPRYGDPIGQSRGNW